MALENYGMKKKTTESEDAELEVFEYHFLSQ